MFQVSIFHCPLWGLTFKEQRTSWKSVPDIMGQLLIRDAGAYMRQFMWTFLLAHSEQSTSSSPISCTTHRADSCITREQKGASKIKIKLWKLFFWQVHWRPACYWCGQDFFYFFGGQDEFWKSNSNENCPAFKWHFGKTPWKHLVTSSQRLISSLNVLFNMSQLLNS